MIRTAICSFGYATRVFHAPLVASLANNYQLVGFVERNNQLSKQYYPNTKIYKSCENLFSDPTIDLVIINTPNPTHYTLCKQALLAGKHVVVDKPFAATSVQARELIDLAQKQNKILSVFHNKRFEGETQLLKKIVESRVLGNIHEVEFKFERYRIGLNPKRHKEEPAPANGIVYELGVHLIDLAIYLFGQPNKVQADIKITREFSQLEDYCSIDFFYPSKMRVNIRCSLLTMDQGPAFTLHGSRGSFTKARANIQEEQLASGMSPLDPIFAHEHPDTSATLSVLTADQQIERTRLVSPVCSYLEYYQQLAIAIEQNKQALVPVSTTDALHGIELIESAYSSAKN